MLSSPSCPRDIARKALSRWGMSESLAETILLGARTKDLPRGATVFLQGDRADAMYIVLEGWVKLYRLAPNGAEAVVGVFTAGQSFGEAVALNGQPFPVTGEAVTDTQLLRIDAGNLIRQIEEEPRLGLSMLAASYMHLQSLVAQVEALKAQTGAQRVAEFLSDLAPCEAGPCRVTLPYDKVLIAGRLGMKPESLSRAFARLREIGVTIKANQAEVERIEALRSFAESDPADAWVR